MSKQFYRACSTLKEEDLWSGLWQRRAHFPETVIAVAYEQQGFFEQAQGSYELAMTKARQEFTNTVTPVSLQSEYRYVCCCFFVSKLAVETILIRLDVAGCWRTTGSAAARS